MYQNNKDKIDKSARLISFCVCFRCKYKVYVLFAPKSNTEGLDYFQLDTFLSFIGKQIKNDQIISTTIEDNTYYIRLLSQLKGRKQLSAKLKNGKSKKQQ